MVWPQLKKSIWGRQFDDSLTGWKYFTMININAAAEENALNLLLITII